MTPLKQKMIKAMSQRRFSERTHQSYLYSISSLAKYFGRPPESLHIAELQQYFDYLVQDKQLAASSCLLQLNAIRFLYTKVLDWPSVDINIVLPKRPQYIPELLTRREVRRIINACKNDKHRVMLQLCYGCGLRVSELVAVKVQHIDGERRLLKVRQGKGNKDRMVVIGETLLSYLRDYWNGNRPALWMFPSASRDHHLNISTLQRVYKQAKIKAGVDKAGGIHGLRHAFATHQLEAGMPVNDLQYQMGHTYILTTLRYVHWVPNDNAANRRGDDLLGEFEGEDA